ncbi:MAG: hypothetical protein HN472_09570 [Nitrospina sp.]|nr:hypothetical protein [Nitrospina sp.]MBT3509774.1 hypothetical protein [Nitrospina sp.]MBT3874873.1 hypothetical protein [Nitrospina sp.]MBT4049772.1 hypothetical protein [Nitrospina sp.]MBT4558746.1 hypothetical protein [Nitrospina sp.]
MDDPKKEFERLRLLFDYTKFHIGMYTTIIGISIGVIKIGPGNIEINISIFVAAIILFLIAGLAGGVIASSTPEYTSYTEFLKAEIFPGKRGWLKFTAKSWIRKEHRCFWIAVALLLLSFWNPLFLRSLDIICK